MNDELGAILMFLKDYYRSSAALELTHENMGRAAASIITNLLLMFSLEKFLVLLVAR